MREESYQLTWDHFPLVTCKAFNGLFRDEDFSDVTIVCETDKLIKAHKVVLSYGSPFFERILRKNVHPNPMIYLMGLKQCDLDALVKFLYYGEVNVSVDNLESFLRAAKQLEIEGLKNYEEKTKAVTETMNNSLKEDEMKINFVGSNLPKDVDSNSQISFRNNSTLSVPSSQEILVEKPEMTPSKKVSFDSKVAVTEFERETDSSFDISTCSVESTTEEEIVVMGNRNKTPCETCEKDVLDQKHFCEQCGREFTNIENLDRHMKLVHRLVDEIL